MIVTVTPILTFKTLQVLDQSNLFLQILEKAVITYKEQLQICLSSGWTR
jgi:hypothetical protein